MDNDDINGARAVVLYLCRNGLSWYRTVARPKPWEITYKAVRGRFIIYENVDEVDGTLLRGDEVDGIVDGEIPGRYILLAPPGGRPVVCLLGVRWRLSAESTEMTLYLHLFGQSQQKGVSTWHRGYRLELPHKSGIHYYTHVQPLRSAGWQDRADVLFAEPGVPDSFPAFPLRGSNLTTLCAALAIALSTDLQHILRELRGYRTRCDVESLLG